MLMLLVLLHNRRRALLDGLVSFNSLMEKKSARNRQRRSPTQIHCLMSAANFVASGTMDCFAAVVFVTFYFV